MFYTGTSNKIMQVGKLGRIKLVFFSLALTRVINILFEKLTPQIEDWI